mgnify:FL=1
MQYKTSFTGGERSAHGALAEIVVHEFIGGSHDNTFDYDILAPNGWKVDVKNKVISKEPKDYYEVSIMGNNDKQECDYLFFTMMPKNGSIVWLCGGYLKKIYMQIAEFKAKGSYTGNNNLLFKRDNYVMTLGQLDDARLAIKILTNDILKDYVTTDLAKKLQNIKTLDELYGFANRRKVLNVDLPKWTEEERKIILMRKYELEKQNVKKK